MDLHCNFELPYSPVVAYVTEEVRRQGHNVETQDGITRVGWMLMAWAYALNFGDVRKPEIEDVEKIGRLVEQSRNREGFRSVGVRVGSRLCPPPDRVESLLTALFLQRDALTALEFYKGFEEVHPFVDGNGRTGKILLNWLNGTLLKPVFPPSNLWGREIQNP